MNKAGRWNLIGWVELEDGDWPMGVGPGGRFDNAGVTTRGRNGDRVHDSVSR